MTDTYNVDVELSIAIKNVCINAVKSRDLSRIADAYTIFCSDPLAVFVEKQDFIAYFQDMIDRRA